jgi:hypothetical protein
MATLIIENDDDYWQIYGCVISPKTLKPSRIGGPSAYKVICMLLKKSPNSKMHKKRLQYMAADAPLWRRKMKNLLETHFD